MSRITRFIHKYTGFLGRHAPSSNAYEIEFGYRINGSGKEAFGGADKWPHITLRIAFEEGQELEAYQFYRKLHHLLWKFQADRGVVPSTQQVPQEIWLDNDQRLWYYPDKHMWSVRHYGDPHSVDGWVLIDDVNQHFRDTFFGGD